MGSRPQPSLLTGGLGADGAAGAWLSRAETEDSSFREINPSEAGTSRFCEALPLVPQSARYQCAPESDMHACPAGDHLARGERPLSILVVEDEVLIRMMMANELRRAGYQVVEAAHADEALDVLKSSSRVDLMITDIAMPLGSMDGTKLARFVRGRWPQTKVMIASAHPPEGPEALDAYIDKPVNPDKLIERVKDLLKI